MLEVRDGTLIIFIGTPASGKTALAKRLGFSCVSSDDIREELFSNSYEQTRNNEVFEEFRKRIKANLQKGITTIADATNIKKFARKSLYEIARETGSDVVIVLMNVPFEKLRSMNRKSSKFVPEHIVWRMLNQLYREYEYIEREAENIGAKLIHVFYK